jgi:hypothetical protein
MTICGSCASEHPRTNEIMVRCAGSVRHGSCGWCWNANAQTGIIYEVRSDCVGVAWEGKDKHGPQRPSKLPFGVPAKSPASATAT